MPRMSRKKIKTNYVHIIVQGINQEFIFQKDEFKQAYKYLLKKKIANTKAKVLAYCIMGNHAHILLYSKNITEISQIMHNTNTSYAKMYNKINKRKGYVFRDRFNSQVISSENHLFNCIAYIHNNPVKANIVKNPETYNYSSYNEFIGKKDLITNDSINIVFGKEENFAKKYYEIHKRQEIEDIIEVNDANKDKNKIIDEFMSQNNRNLSQIMSDEKIFCNLLLKLRYDAGLSLRDMAKIFNINKDKLNKIININIWDDRKTARQKPRPIV